MSFLRQFFGPSSNSWLRALVLFILAWGFFIYLFVSKLNPQSSSGGSSTDHDNTVKRINEALQMLEQSRQRNDELRQMIDEFLNEPIEKQSAKKLIDQLEQKLQNDEGHKRKSGNGNESREPSAEYEHLRRRVRSNVQEMWNFFSNELGKIRKKIGTANPEIAEEIRSVLELGVEHKRSLIVDIDRMKEIDGYEDWRIKEADNLSALVQKRLHHLQNPSDCQKARKLICQLNKGCGYGCQLHHIVYCFIVAYATERTMILKSKGWRYHSSGWEEIFFPISENCYQFDSSWITQVWPIDHQVVVLPIIDSLVPRPSYLPLSIPEDLAPRLKRLHGDPIVWWIGQFLKYLLRPQSSTQELLDNGLRKLGFIKPIVGVHVRRTDKVGTEAAFHGIEEYMSHVEDYFLTLEMNGTKVHRRIFLASDDARVLAEARKKYPNYDIIGDPDVARMAAVSTRYTDSSLNGIILDIHLLSLSDYLVCTFSSQVCRVAYEIMQTMHPDASHRFRSLDDIYYYGGQNSHNRIAVIDHKPRNHDEIYMKVGDIVGVAGNHWDGFSKGKSTRTNQMGLFPSFKVIDKIETVPMPTYSEA